MANCGLLSAVTGESTGPGGDSTGASAEREGGIGHQSKAGLAQGGYKGAREVLARHDRTTHYPAVGLPGGVLRTQRTTQPSRMGPFDGIWWLVADALLRTERVWHLKGTQRAPQGNGYPPLPCSERGSRR
jgi:hypothetical protein